MRISFAVAAICILALMMSGAPPCHALDGDRQSPASLWKFNGDVNDSGTTPLNGKIVGRATFFDSPITGAGQLLSLNGVDACAQIEDAKPLNLAADFSLSLWFFPLETKAQPLLHKAEGDHGWSLEVLPDGALQFTAASTKLTTPAQTVAAGQWFHVVVSVQRAEKGDLSALYINGRRAAAGNVPAAADLSTNKPLLIGKSPANQFFNGLIDELAIYNTPLTLEEVAKVTDAGLPWARRPEHVATPFADNHFTLEKNDVIATVGGENAYGAQQAAALETLATAAAPDKNILFRNMGWEGDTVFEQWRILNFGPWPKQFEHTGATVLLVNFGQMESLRGQASLPDFIAAYDKLLDEFAKTTRRIVLVSPIAFEKVSPLLPDLTTRNDDLHNYVEAIRELAKKRNCLFVDLFSMKPAEKHRTRDGIHLSPAGQWAVAWETARQLNIAPATPPELFETADSVTFRNPPLEELRTAIVAKNKLWIEYWRPNNWAFLAGDRITQPSSRDHIDPRIRWFPTEMQQFPALIRHAEIKIETLARGLHP